MLLSEVLKEQGESFKYEITNEKTFDTLALAGGAPGTSFCTFLESEKYFPSLSPLATMVFTTKELANAIVNTGRGVCIVDSPRIAFFSLHNSLSDNKMYIRENQLTHIGINCKISQHAFIADKNVVIGDNVTIEEFVSIKENTVIEDNCIIRAGTIIGGEGFEHKRNGKNIISVKHLGGVIIKHDVELQQGNFVDKAIYPWDNTIVGEKTKTDNNVHIAHADKIGKRVFIAACTCIAGRVETGDDVWIGPGVTIINGITIGDRAKISIGSVVTKPIMNDEHVTGNFAINHNKFIENLKKSR